MKFASIHKDKKGYIFTTLSKTISGLLISTQPELRIYNNSEIKEIIEALFKVLNSSKEDVPTPNFRNLKDSKNKSKEKLKILDIKSFNSLNKPPTLFCTVKYDSNEIVLLPSKLDKSMGKGFVNIDQVVKVNANSPMIEIYNAIKDAFSKCG